MFFNIGNVLSESKKAVFPPNYKFMTDEEYYAAMRGQDKFHGLLRAGDASFKQGDYPRAERYFLEAYEFSKGSSVEAVALGELARFYEKTGSYEKSIQYVDIFLSKLKKNEPSWHRYTEMRMRLLKKIEAQKRGEKIEGQKPSIDRRTKPIQKANDFYKADYGSQKKFLEKELPEETEILRLGKQAMLAEHAGKFAEAKGFYEQMLPRKDEAIVAFGESGWVMLYPAAQRMSELTGDEAREKEMLVWIRDNMLAEQGAYHKYLPGLLPPVQEHLKERIKVYRLQ